MEIDLSGVWTGEMKGTNIGGMSLELQHSGDRIYGQGQFYEPTLGVYSYDIQGAVKDEQVTFFLTPKPNQSYRLGNIQATCALVNKNDLKGTWKSTLGTSEVAPFDWTECSLP